MNEKLPLPTYKVFLTQFIERLSHQLNETGLKPTSRRNALLQDLRTTCAKLEREFKRDTTLAAIADTKFEVYSGVYNDGEFPAWLIDGFFNAIMIETRQLKALGRPVE